MAELNVDGMVIAPNVVETIVSLAARDVDGVAGIGDSATGGLVSFISGKPSTDGVEIDVDENNKLHISIRMCVESGLVLPDVAAAVRKAVADAVNSQVGIPVGSVDIYIDGIQFDK
jgi:uncharacterized alkaline shock family protein YloU